MANHDGDGWVDCRCLRRHWGVHGAAGLFLMRPAAMRGNAPFEVLVQLRAGWTHEGGCWGLPGGARDSHEDPVPAALREAHEELGIDPGKVQVLGTRTGTDHTDWRYVYVVGLADGEVRVELRTSESDDARWVDPHAVSVALHPALARDWANLNTMARHLYAQAQCTAGRESSPPTAGPGPPLHGRGRKETDR
jgi:8-oxo-dGTP diphosphatase